MLDDRIVLFDITRLLSRRNALHPTGIDRVDLAYANELKETCGNRCHFLFQVDGNLHLVPDDLAERYLRYLSGKWRAGPSAAFDVEKAMKGAGLLAPSKPKQSKSSPKHKVTDDDLTYLFGLPYNERLKFVVEADLAEYLPSSLHWFARSPLFFRAPVLAGVVAAAPLLRASEAIGKSIGRLAGMSYFSKAVVDESAEASPLCSHLRKLLRGNRSRTPLYVNASHHGIDNLRPFLQLRTEFSCDFAFFIHDLIPIQFPEYVRTGDEVKHAKRMRVISQLNPLIICNSRDTQAVLDNYFRSHSLGSVTSLVAHIGLEDHFVDSIAKVRGASPKQPYFVAIGTLEVRKNHLLLLNIWRELSQRLDEPPILYLVGRRGWENQAVFNMLDRCSALHGKVIELPDTNDEQIASLTTGARALLFPTFAEGWGMPLVEALAFGTPAICSDLPVLREASQGLAVYLDPLDYVSWRDTILDFSSASSERRQSQIDRLAQFCAPNWKDHFEKVLPFLDSGFSLSPGSASRPLIAGGRRSSQASLPEAAE